MAARTGWWQWRSEKCSGSEPKHRISSSGTQSGRGAVREEGSQGDARACGTKNNCMVLRVQDRISQEWALSRH